MCQGQQRYFGCFFTKFQVFFSEKSQHPQFSAAKDLVVGILSLLWGIYEVLTVLQIEAYGGVVPEQMEEDVEGIRNGITQILSDPFNALEAVGQGMFDTVDEKGLAYSMSYVSADLAIGLLMDKKE